MTEPNLISSVILQGREYLVKMNVMSKHLEMLLSDKQTGEEWQCSYDHSCESFDGSYRLSLICRYRFSDIENLTHKTGNFKQFDIFIAMIKSGLLKTSDSISLELLTFEDLDSLRCKKIRGHSRHFSSTHGNNKRYLIVTYTVEFDRIHYPLPLDYCGPPDPTILQGTIRKLEAELAKVKEENYMKCAGADSRQVVSLQRRIDDLLAENQSLRNEIRELSQMDATPNKQVKVLQRAIINLEKSVLTERKSHHKLVEKLRNDKIKLVKELEMAKSGERSLRLQLDQFTRKRSARKYERQPQSAVTRSNHSLETLYRRPSPVVKSHSEGNRNVRTRSESPRLVKSEGWDRRHEIPKLRLQKSLKQRSRSSSLSSSRNYQLNDFFALETDLMEEKPARRLDARKKQTKFVRSRSSSASNSSNSSGISEIPLGRESVRSVRTKLKNSKKEFQTLEKRIKVLQNILKENLKAKDFS